MNRRPVRLRIVLRPRSRSPRRRWPVLARIAEIRRDDDQTPAYELAQQRAQLPRRRAPRRRSKPLRTPPPRRDRFSRRRQSIASARQRSAAGDPTRSPPHAQLKDRDRRRRSHADDQPPTSRCRSASPSTAWQIVQPHQRADPLRGHARADGRRRHVGRADDARAGSNRYESPRPPSTTTAEPGQRPQPDTAATPSSSPSSNRSSSRS